MTTRRHVISQVDRLHSDAARLRAEIDARAVDAITDDEIISRIEDDTATERHLRALKPRIIDQLKCSIVDGSFTWRHWNKEGIKPKWGPYYSFEAATHLVAHPMTTRLPEDRSSPPWPKEPVPRRIIFEVAKPNQLHHWFQGWCEEWLMWEAADHDPDCVEMRTFADWVENTLDSLEDDEDLDVDEDVFPHWWGAPVEARHEALMAPILDPWRHMQVLRKPTPTALELYRQRHPTG